MKIIIVHIGTNSIQHATAKKVAEGIAHICQKLHERSRYSTIILTGILPGEGKPLCKVVSVNIFLNVMHHSIVLTSVGTCKLCGDV